jgi:FdhD protein
MSADSTTTPLHILRAGDNQAAEADDEVVLERAVGIAINGVEVALLMALPGHEEELAAGFALSEGVIRSRGDLLAMRVCAPDDPGASDGCLIRLTVPADLFSPDPGAGPVVTRFACGTVGKSLLRREPRAVESGLTMPAAALQSARRAMAQRQPVYRATGGTHGAAVCDAGGRIRVLREDIGRHNAADKALGHCLLNDISLRDAALVITGRASSEMVLKAATAGVPVLASMSAPTALGVQLAQRYELTLVGFLRPRRMNVYSGGERIALSGG